MPLPDEKFDTDAKRAKSRSFGGYLKDRLTGSEDFSTNAAKAPRARVLGESSLSKGDREMAFKKGGRVKAPPAAKKSCW